MAESVHLCIVSCCLASCDVCLSRELKEANAKNMSRKQAYFYKLLKLRLLELWKLTLFVVFIYLYVYILGIVLR